MCLLVLYVSTPTVFSTFLEVRPEDICHQSEYKNPGKTIYHLVMTNSSPWKDPAFLSSVEHLFRLGPSIPWRTVSHHQRLFLAISTEMSQLSTPPKKMSQLSTPQKNGCEKSPSFSHVLSFDRSFFSTTSRFAGPGS